MSATSDLISSINGVGGVVVKGGYAMGEASGNGLDLIASHPIVWSGSPTYGQSPLNSGTTQGNSMGLDGTDDMGAIANYVGIGPGTNDFWFYLRFLTSLNDNRALLNLYDPADQGWRLTFNGDELVLQGFGADIISAPHSSTAWRDGVAHEVWGLADRDGFGQLYRGDVASGSAVDITAGVALTIGTAGTSATKALDIGSRFGSGDPPLPFQGRLSHFYWGTGLPTGTTRTDMTSIFTTGALPAAPGDPASPSVGVHTPRGARPMRWRVSG